MKISLYMSSGLLVTCSIGETKQRIVSERLVCSNPSGYASVNPVVVETIDGYLSDTRIQPIGLEQVAFAMAVAVTL